MCSCVSPSVHISYGNENPFGFFCTGFFSYLCFQNSYHLYILQPEQKVQRERGRGRNFFSRRICTSPYRIQTLNSSISASTCIGIVQRRPYFCEHTKRFLRFFVYLLSKSCLKNVWKCYNSFARFGPGFALGQSIFCLTIELKIAGQKILHSLIHIYTCIGVHIHTQRNFILQNFMLVCVVWLELHGLGKWLKPHLWAAVQTLFTSLYTHWHCTK